MTLAVSLPITAFVDTPWVDRSFSEEGGVIRRAVNAVLESSGSTRVGEVKHAAQEALDAAYNMAQVDDWDGEGSARVEPSTYGYASQFILLLPSTSPLPEIMPDTDGEILFEWDQGHRLVFSVSVGRDGTLTFAGLFGHAKIHGIEHLREALPLAVSDSLGRISFASGT